MTAWDSREGGPRVTASGARRDAAAERARRQVAGSLRSVRRRWRLRRALQGAAIVLAAACVAFALSAFAIDRLRFDPTAILVFRIAAWTAVAAVAVRWLVLPLLRRAPDPRVALYLEEHEPSLGGTVLTAVEAAPAAKGKPGAGRGAGAEAGGLASGLLERAAERLRSVERGRRVERRGLRHAGAWLAGAVTAALILALAGPAFLDEAGPLLLAPWRTAEGASPYAIEVEPGNVRVPRGADQKVTARLRGFEAADVEVAVRRGAAGEGVFERLRMTPSADGTAFEVFLFDLAGPAEYLVEAAGVRSPLHRIEVADLPYVDRIELEYRFPAYTGLAPRTVEDGGDIAALRGTRVWLRITPTLPVSGGRLVFQASEGGRGAGDPGGAVGDRAAGSGGERPGADAGDARAGGTAEGGILDPIPLVEGEDGRLTGTIDVERELFYRVELEAPTGERVTASPDYLIEPLDDQPPSVAIVRPGRDMRATSVDELFVEVEAEDDYDVGRLELAWSVNGGEEERVVLQSGGGKRLLRGHTLFLEEMGLEPGDLIAYHARATDGRRGDRDPAVSDLYFVEIQPFDRAFRQADQAPAPGGGGMEGALSEQQRQIIAGTFNLVRDRQAMGGDEASENLTTLALVQGRLRQRVEELVAQMGVRGVAADSGFRTIAEELPLAAEAMGEAEERLGAGRPREALPPEQRALQHLQRAEAAFREVRISLQQGGGPGGGGASSAEELADLFELELDKLRNQYESVERGERQQRDREVDEALQRLQELARRQEQLNERTRRGAQGGGDGRQSGLLEETEELARQLERLSREDPAPELRESARRLRDAADAMRRAAASGREGGSGEGEAAVGRLRDARRLLESRRAGALERALEDAARQAERVAERQREMAGDVERALRGAGEDGRAGERGGREGRARAVDPEEARRLGERKDALAGEVESLERELDRLARESRREHREASEELRGAAGSIRDNKLREKILYSKGVVEAGAEEYARNLERDIAAGTEELRERVDRARRAFGEADPREEERRLAEARDLVRGLESLRERIRQREGTAEGQEGEGGGEGAEAREEEEGREGEGSEGAAGEARGEDAEGQGERGGQQGEEEGGQGQGEGREGRGQDEGQGEGRGDGEGRGEAGARQGQGRTGPGAPGGGAGRFAPGDVRQFRREFRERREDAESLRRELAEAGVDVGELESAIARLRALDDARVYSDREEVERLQEAVLTGLKEFEFALRRTLEGPGEERLFLRGSDAVPPEYREMVEEYYRSLSEDPPR